MSITDVILAVEDELSEAISTQILSEFDIEIRYTIRGKGNVLLRQKAPELNRAANAIDVFLLTDLDSPQDCPPGLIYSWIKAPLNPRFLFRVAVMEVESWVMADRVGFSKFLSIPSHRIPSPTDNILNPKEFLVSLARRSQKKRIREALVPTRGTNLTVGIEYNILLSEFVQDHWDLQRAASVSPSLKRTLDRLSQEKAVNADQ
ncbi:hypothetical protein C6501_02625 [Candidatus Poribacteria bacterium]|nr:MAG: hypothetical protein C6501_02625 [Candidatus Poribacteria bacterium]